MCEVLCQARRVFSRQIYRCAARPAPRCTDISPPLFRCGCAVIIALGGGGKQGGRGAVGRRQRIKTGSTDEGGLPGISVTRTTRNDSGLAGWSIPPPMPCDSEESSCRRGISPLGITYCPYDHRGDFSRAPACAARFEMTVPSWLVKPHDEEPASSDTGLIRQPCDAIPTTGQPALATRTSLSQPPVRHLRLPYSSQPDSWRQHSGPLPS